MKKLILLIILSLCSVFLLSQVVNMDNPKNGIWEPVLKMEWEKVEVEDNPFVNLNKFQIDNKGRIYAFDLKYYKHYVFNSDGKLLFSFGNKGEGPGEYKISNDFFLLDDYIVVLGIDRLHYFSKSGEYFETKVIPGYDLYPRELVNKDEFISYPIGDLVEEEDKRLLLYNIATKKRTLISDIAGTKSVNFIHKQGGAQMHISISDPSTVTSIITELKDELLFYAKNDCYLINCSNLKGEKIFDFSIKGRKPAKISESYKRAKVMKYRINGKPPTPTMANNMIKSIPDYCTLFFRISLDGPFIYAFQNNISNKQVQEVDVFSRKGQYLYKGKIKLPDGYSKMYDGFRIKNGFLYMVAGNEDDNLSLIKFKIQNPLKIK